MIDPRLNFHGHWLGRTGVAFALVLANIMLATSPAAANPSDQAPTRRATDRSVNASRSSDATTAHHIEDLDFHRDASGAGRVVITLNNADGAVKVTRHDGQVIATLANTSLPKHLQRRIDVRDFATPIRFVETTTEGNNTRLIITPEEDAEFKHSVHRSGHQLSLVFKPISVSQTTAKSPETTHQYTGQPISLSFQQIDIRAVLKIIADIANVNLVVANNVSGKVTLRLKDVPWDQALHIILRSQGLSMHRVGNVINIAPLAQITQRKQAQLDAYQATRNMVPLQSEIIGINYARAADIAALLQADNDKQTAMLSKRGQITVDKRTNSLLVTDTAAKLHDIREVVDRLDVPVSQVLIEARIVVANRGFNYELGISQAATTNAGAGVPSVNSFTGESGYTINLPSATSAGRLITSIISSSFSLDLALSAMESENRGEIMSAPRVITTDGQQALIEQGQQIPYTTVQDDGQSNTQFKEVLLNLTVTPHITPDKHVLLDIELTQDSLGEISVKGEPAINTRRIKTQVLVDNGNTVVLGGIYQQQRHNKKAQIPVLGDVPVVGALFSNTSRRHRQRELLLFITPRILEETLTSR